MKKILFVCHGNICRSVMAEYIFKSLDQQNDFYVESRATTRDNIGSDIYPPVKEVLRKNNIYYDKHRARQVTFDDYYMFDFIICMDQENLDDLEYLLPSNDKTRLLDRKEIKDPWYTRDFDSCYRQIYDSCIHLMSHLLKER